MPEGMDTYIHHLTGCDFCRELVGQFQTVADLLPDALEEQIGSPGLKERILTQASAELESAAGRATPRMVEKRRVRWRWQWPSWATLSPVRVSAVLAFVVAGLVAWNISLQLAVDDEGDSTAQQRNLIEAIRSGARIFELSGTEAAPEASARLVQPVDSVRVFLLVQNLPQLPSGQLYEVWSITEGAPTSVGTFALTTDREQLTTLFVDFTSAQAIGISIEQKGGSPTGRPIGPIVLLGDIQD